MQLKLFIPSRILLDTEVAKITTEGVNGTFSILPRHVDFVTVIVPGILFFQRNHGREGLIAIDDGILVKCGENVFISTQRAIEGEDLEGLEETVEREFQQLDEQEKRARSALARLEAGFLRGTYDYRGAYDEPFG